MTENLCQFCGAGPEGEHSRRCHEQALARVAELESALRMLSKADPEWCRQYAPAFAQDALKGQNVD